MKKEVQLTLQVKVTSKKISTHTQSEKKEYYIFILPFITLDKSYR